VDGAVVSALTVEFCGLPGAGKSHLVDEVRRALLELDVPVAVATTELATPTPKVARAGTKCRLAAYQLRRDPAHASRVASCLLHGAQRRVGDGPRQLLQWLAVQELLHRSTLGAGVHLLDEGPLQILWSVGLWGEPEPLLRLLEQAPARWRRTGVVVVVRVRPEVASIRLAERLAAHSRVESLRDPVERLRTLRRGSERLDDLVRRWERLDTPVLLADALDPGAARRLARQLRQLAAAMPVAAGSPPAPSDPATTPSSSERQEPP
jgi:hypothetical protein